MSLKNFLPLRREVMEHWVYKDSDFFKIWVEMLFKARFTEGSKKELYKTSLYILNQGEFLFSRITWYQRLNIKEHKVKKCVKLMIDDNMIVKVGRVGSSGATIYKIINYKSYNNQSENTPAIDVDNTDVEGDARQPLTSHKTAIDQPLTTKEERKKEKIVNNSDIELFFNECWKLYPRKKGKGSVSDTKKKELYKLGDEFKRCITRFVKENTGKETNFLPYGSTFFNTGYIDYLDENYTVETKQSSGPIFTDLSKVEVKYIDGTTL